MFKTNEIRYSDFDWLYQNLASKYYGYVIPIPPPKNILTTLNKQGAEFAEERKKDLITFLKKCMKHHFLKTVPELTIFLSDDKGFFNFKKREENLNQHKKDRNLLEKITNMVNAATKTIPYHLVEMGEIESQLYNYEVMFSNLFERLQLFYDAFQIYLESKRKRISTILGIVSGFQELSKKHC